MSAFLERRLVIVAFVASVIFALIAFAYVGLKTPASATMVSGNASIYFEIDDSVVLFATDCVTARWQADGIRSIKFNDQGVIGQDERDLCELGATLTVKLQDNREVELRLERRVLVEALPVRVLFVLATVCLLASAYGAFPALRRFVIAPAAARPRPRWTTPSRSVTLATVCGILLIGVALRVSFLSVDMRTDEAWTFNSFASRPLAEALADYTTTNNHLLHTILVHIAYITFGNEPWVLRLPAFFAGVLVIAATYQVGARFYGRGVGLVAAALVSASSYMVTYSTNARGYTLMTICFLLLLALLPQLVQAPSRRRWLAFILLTALGMYAVPTMTFAVGVAALWLMLAFLNLQAYGPRIREMVALVTALAAAAVLTGLLYLPTLTTTVSASADDIELGHLRTLDINAFSRTVGEISQLTWSLWNRDLPVWLTAALTFGSLICLLFHARVSRHAISLPFVTFLAVAGLVFLQFGRSYARLWLFLLPLYYLFGVAGLGLVIRSLEGRLKVTATTWLPEWAVAATALVLTVMLSVQVYHSGSPESDGETGDFEPTAVTQLLAPELREGDFVLCSQSCNQLRYTFNYQGLPFVPGNDVQAAAPDRIFIVVVHGRQVIWDLLKFGVDDSFTEPVLFHDFPSSDIYVVERRVNT